MENGFFKRLKSVNYRICKCCGNCASYHQTTEIDYWDSDFDDEPPENPDAVVSRMCYDDTIGEIEDKVTDDNEQYFEPHPCCVCDKWRLKYTKVLFIDIDEIMTPHNSGAVSESAMNNLVRIIDSVPDIMVVPMNIYNNGNAGGIDFRIEYIHKYLENNCKNYGFRSFLHTDIYTDSGIIGTIDSKKILDFLKRIGNYDRYLSIAILTEKELDGWLGDFQYGNSLRYEWKTMESDFVDELIFQISDISNVADIRELCSSDLNQKTSQQEPAK